MSALNILGGIGAGLQQGVGFMQQKKMQDEQLRLAQERNTMLAEQANRQAKEFEQKQAEVERVQKLSEMRNGIYQNYPDANRYQREQMFVDEAVKSGMLRGDELDTAFAGVEKLKQQFGAEAYGAAINGDIKPLQQVLGQKGIAVDYDPSGKNLLLWQEGNARDAAGNLQPRTISVDGLLQMDVMAEARRRQQEAAKAALETQKVRAGIAADQAKANKDNSIALGNVTEDVNGNIVARSKGKAAGGADMLSPEDFGKAAEKYVGAEAEFDMARAYTLYTNMLENTRTANGQPMSPGQRAAAFEDALRIARGEGVQTPDLRDGRLALTATIDGRSYVIDPDYTEMQALSLKDADGNPRYTAQTIDNIYMDAMRTGAVSNPQQFGAVWQIVNDPAALAEAQQRHDQGDARMGDILRAASVIQRGIARANETAKPGRSPEFSRIFNSLEKPGGMLGTSGTFTDAVRDATR